MKPFCIHRCGRRVSRRAIGAVKEARSKYGAVKETVDGHTFHSKAEARRYGELKLLEKAGQIQGLTLQCAIDLSVPKMGTPHATVVVGRYLADFKYYDPHTGQYVVEDVKGFATPLYRWKKKHVEAQYGIRIVEIR